MNTPRVPPTLVPTLTEVVHDGVPGPRPPPAVPLANPAQAAGDSPAEAAATTESVFPVITDEWVDRLERAIEARVVAQVGPMLNRWSGDLAAEIRRGLRDEIRLAVAAAMAAERDRQG